MDNNKVGLGLFFIILTCTVSRPICVMGVTVYEGRDGSTFFHFRLRGSGRMSGQSKVSEH